MAKKKSGGKWKSRLKRLVLFLFVSSFLYVLLCRWMFPPITLTQCAALIDGYGMKRSFVAADYISDNVKLAAIASEDQLFAEHNGFDWKALEKSFQNPKGKKTSRPSGGAASTISQQVAKNVFLWQGSGWHRYVRKGLEFYFTFLIELCWSKERILEVYLNVIEMGPGVFGIEAAANQYFRKSAARLSPKEAAMIIACLPNPKRFSVQPMSKRVQWRYPQILKQMNNLQSDSAIKQLLGRKK